MCSNLTLFSVSGCTDYYAADEYEGFQTGRDIIEGLNLPTHSGPSRAPEEPLYDPEEILGLIPRKDQENMDVRQVCRYPDSGNAIFLFHVDKFVKIYQ